MKDVTKTLWSGRVEAWRRSGKTAAQFAAGQPFTGSTLKWRAHQLGRANASETSPRPKVRATRGSERPQPRRPIGLVEVVRRAPPVPQSAGVTLDVGGVRIAVLPGFDEALLCTVVRAMREVLA